MTPTVSALWLRNPPSLSAFLALLFVCVRTGLIPEGTPLPIVQLLKQLDSERPWGPQLSEADLVITNYHQLNCSQIEKQLRRDTFDAIIVDEAHHAESQGFGGTLSA